jgi:uncharacterized membrane protein YsdA (DUF1294 family)
MLRARMSNTAVLAAIAALLAWNLITWATYRIDKARARAARGARRIPERTLLAMAAAGGSIGALLAVYGHRQRHKAQKLAFVVPLWAIVAAHAALAGLAAYTLGR